MTRLGNMYGPDTTFLGVPAADLADPATFAGADVVILGAPHRSTVAPHTGQGPGSDHRQSGSPITCRTTVRGSTWRWASTRSPN